MVDAPGYPIVVNAPHFNETSGGSIVLHYLVDRLRAFGIDAYIYPFLTLRKYPPWSSIRPGDRLWIWAKNARRKMLLTKNFKTHPQMDVPIARKRILRDAIVVYPEIVSGNPLRSRRVVRWLLHKPGFFRKDVVFGEDDLFFYFQPAFRDDSLQIDPANQLRLLWVRDDVYRDLGLPGREGTCRLIRKGKVSGMDTVPDDGSILIDGLSHEEKAEVFNRTRYLYCHDPYTMYCFYAALCGCIPIVLPQPGLSREAWRPNEADRYGVAYGEDDIEWAIVNEHPALTALILTHVYKE